jgi:hypothetical protein
MEELKPVNKKSRLFNILTATLTTASNSSLSKDTSKRTTIEESIRSKLSIESQEIRQKLLQERKEKQEKIQLEKLNNRLDLINEIVSFNLTLLSETHFNILTFY